MNSDLKTALKSIARNKLQSFISIFGLGIGLGCVILLLALMLHETSFDKFIPQHENVYRAIFGKTCQTAYPLAEAMKEDLPEVKGYFRYYQTNKIQLRIPGEETVSEEFFGFSDPAVFSIMGIKFTAGTAANSLTEVTISESMAMKYFNSLSPLGKIISVKFNDEMTDLSVSGVYKDFPHNSTLHPLFIADIKLSEKLLIQFQKSLGDYGNAVGTSLNWTTNNFLTYLVLDGKADKESLVTKMDKYTEFRKNEKNKDLKYSLQPVTEIHLGSQEISGDYFTRRGIAGELKYYGAISLIILLIAVTNYIFLTRAGSSKRLGEMGTRKVLGATPSLIRKQIIVESNLIAILSLIPAAYVISFGVPFINSTLNKTLNTDVFINPLLVGALLSIVLLVGTLSGFLIGFKISRVSSLLLLSGKTTEVTKSGRWNYSFLIFHFSIYIILVVSVVVVSKQIRYSLTNDDGINPSNVLICPLNSQPIKSSFKAICNEIEKVPGVVRTAGSSFVPPFNAMLPINLQSEESEMIKFDGLIMGEGMTELLEMDVIDGEPLGTYHTGSQDVLFNESSAVKYKVKAGKYFSGFLVRGVVKDFHAHSFHTPILPLVIIQQNPTKMALLVIKTDGKNDKAIIKQLHDIYAEFSPNDVFEVKYLTDQINDFYKHDRNQGKIMGAFSILAAVLSVMGLFGIALIAISKKTKEIGLRKVNGASILQVLYLLNIDYIRWVIISIVVAVPASVWIMSAWLKRYAYKTELSWWIFAAAATSALIVALVTVSGQSVRTATRNPVEALRHE